MAQYIDKADVVAEIKKRIKEIDEIGTYLSPKGVLTNLLCHLDTLEIKDVDLDKEVTLYIHSNTHNGYFRADIHDVAKHFFQLGLTYQDSIPVDSVVVFK